jgi:hypothetical protein
LIEEVTQSESFHPAVVGHISIVATKYERLSLRPEPAGITHQTRALEWQNVNRCHA